MQSLLMQAACPVKIKEGGITHVLLSQAWRVVSICQNFTFACSLKVAADIFHANADFI